MQKSPQFARIMERCDRDSRFTVDSDEENIIIANEITFKYRPKKWKLDSNALQHFFGGRLEAFFIRKEALIWDLLGSDAESWVWAEEPKQ